MSWSSTSATMWLLVVSRVDRDLLASDVSSKKLSRRPMQVGDSFLIHATYRTACARSSESSDRCGRYVGDVTVTLVIVAYHQSLVTRRRRSSTSTKRNATKSCYPRWYSSTLECHCLGCTMSDETHGPGLNNMKLRNH
ncbi:hypothetical protein OE88DRAFT_1087114 [Heliocybe sulcata]|uniref:Secreted protein n=1 Tax=Heliocybe sulcata TaxID=5364 RepID=A0A5C3MKA9_9AGAM|nr:hypothetical protein OE88DRAFT_1087114 [Heliocybe sulcata]